MKKTTKEVVKEGVEVLEISKAELIEVTGNIVGEMIEESMSENRSVIEIFETISTTADLVGRLLYTLFDDDNTDESEEN